MSTEIKQKRSLGGHSRIYWRDTIEGYLFISPVILGLVIWTFGPMLASFYLSLTDYPLLKAPEFVGFRNYIDIFNAAYLRVLESLWVTLKYAAISLPITLVASLAAAVLLNQRLRGMHFFRTAFYLPTIVPSIAMVFVWGWLLNPEFGLVNATLEALGLPTVRWLAEPETALTSLAVLNLWSIGPAMIIFLAGLQGVSQELYDSAKIDGANQWRRILGHHVALAVADDLLQLCRRLDSDLPVLLATLHLDPRRAALLHLRLQSQPL